jgi:hypothetical protein
MLTCYEQPYATICWNENSKVVELTWKGFATSEEYRKTLEQTLVILKEKKATRLLMDTRNIKVIMPEDQAWALEVWGPKFGRSGGKKLTAVSPQSAVARMNAKDIERNAAPLEAALPFEYRGFATPAEALDWLKS